ncbi:hypothetical protein CWI75_10685 [Kineobactrum sediminis]|uniref:Uncharacterized protein n=1 Tax=Kineobactrum sediminis TaxID=1905677 RepID=A0A2N5Y1H2_9GAMM|nr:hypothetical protein [Kineobactrum sediminis]PLW82236.1 hypothetical protein CWI75_10685 [Kineobactrum sediminis]
MYASPYLQKDRERKLLEQHLEKVRERWKSQDLSVLEMYELKGKLMTELHAAPPAVRDRMEAELDMLDNVLKEEDPKPDTEDDIASLRAHGMKDEADDLEHFHNRRNKREEVDRLRARLELPDLPGYEKPSIETALKKAQEELAQLDSHNPYEREDRMRALRAEAEVLKDQINSLGTPQNDTSRRIRQGFVEMREARLAEAYALEQGEDRTDESDVA